MAVPHDTFRQSLWSAITPAGPDLPDLRGAERADVAVVGAGFLGLSLTLHLARKGVKVVLLEAEEPGFGASGRNTGFVVPSFTAGLGPSAVTRMLGLERGEQLSRFVGGSAAMLFSLVEREQISCAAEQTGWVQPAPSDAKVDMLRQRVAEWQALGQPVELLDAGETARLTGSIFYRGALIDRSGGQINPLAYARGLAAAAIGAGVRIFVRSRAEKWERQGGKWRIDTANGHVVADQAFFTTNALGGRLVPAVAASIIPARPYQVATQPLAAEVRARILPARNPVADLHRHTFAVRWSPDNRLVTGGMTMLNTRGAVGRMAQYFLKRLSKYLPGLPPLQADYAWSGVVATTPQFLPQIWTLGPGLYAPIGCNGRGVAMTTALGAALAEFAITGDQRALPVQPHPPQPHSMPGLLEHGPSLWLAWNRFRDSLDDWQRR